MLSRILTGSFIVASVFLVNGCELIHCHLCEGDNEYHTQEVIEPVTITATGYGAMNPELASNLPQQKLMAMRASEVEAYRTLAERIRGVEVTSNTRVDDFFTDFDEMSAMLNTQILRNARISSQRLSEDGYYETTLALTLGERFFQQFTYHPATASREAEYIYKPATSKYENVRQADIRTSTTTDSNIDMGAGQ